MFGGRLGLTLSLPNDYWRLKLRGDGRWEMGSWVHCTECVATLLDETNALYLEMVFIQPILDNLANKRPSDPNSQSMTRQTIEMLYYSISPASEGDIFFFPMVEIV